jgi:hypothetical protein
MKPKFQHDCDKCEFLGHYFDHDVYVCLPQGFESCEGATAGSIIARHGDDGPEYASSPLPHFQSQLFDREHTIGLGNGKSMPFQDFLFSDEVPPHYKAMVLGLVARGMK